MKRAAGMLVCLIFLSAFVQGGVQERFVEANRQYEAGNYLAAMQEYAVLSRKMENWKLEFNIGNCSVKLNRPVEAKIHFLRALRLAPTRREIRENLQYVDGLLGHEAVARRGGFLANLWNQFVALVPLDAISILLVLAVIIMNVCLVALLWRKKRKWFRYGLGFALAAALALAGIQEFYRHNLDRRDTVVVIRDKARLRSGPGRGNTVLFTLRRGLDARILERRKHWLQVTSGEDVAGWIEREAVEEI